jgi:glutamate 5-kinase
MDFSGPNATPATPGDTGAERPAVAAARRIVVKLGTRVLTHDVGGLALARMFGIVETVAREKGREFLIVSSGAVELGREFLGLDATPADIELRQACAAVGQTRLMALYQDGFSQYGLKCGQVLLTQSDFDDEARYRNLCRTLTTLLERGVVPIINENDAVATEELELHSGNNRPAFGDNDRLSALVAARLNADLLVLLTDVKGLYHRDPRRHDEARLLTRVDPSEDVSAGSAGSPAGRGGMRSKVEAAAVAVRGGCEVVIASGRESDSLERVLRGDEVGTWFPENGSRG